MCMGVSPVLPRDPSSHPVAGVGPVSLTLTHALQALHKVRPELLDAMLGNLLAESPDADRLHCILEHVNLWIVSSVSQERARAIRSSTSLFRFAVTFPEFDISAEFPRMGHHVAQLALFVSDPDKDISQQAREGTYWLYQLLLQQRGKEPAGTQNPVGV
ncbi:maestro heat-like repeat family member 5 [Mauremys mutica]|uniref:maestro heat-like repeat family member 5 n=1 Tax=Mauremys mutica TaxID=74926 RepID=UPI001D165AB9|nr:maestro heat-like repeat family member 5 [Mauremys mutica]